MAAKLQEGRNDQRTVAALLAAQAGHNERAALAPNTSLGLNADVLRLQRTDGLRGVGRKLRYIGRAGRVADQGKAAQF
jgi:hypothetical protein